MGGGILFAVDKERRLLVALPDEVALREIKSHQVSGVGYALFGA